MPAPLRSPRFLLTLFPMPTNSKDYQREYQRQYRKNAGKARRVVSVALPPEVYDEISAYAEAEGTSLSALMRDATFAQVRRSQLRSNGVEAELRELKFLISNIANNVNQLASHSNQVREVADASDVFRQLKDLDDLITDFTTDRMTQR